MTRGITLDAAGIEPGPPLVARRPARGQGACAYGERFGLRIGLADAHRAAILVVTIACGQSLGAPAVGLRLRP